VKPTEAAAVIPAMYRYAGCCAAANRICIQCTATVRLFAHGHEHTWHICSDSWAACSY
jgi:hypothetical protein